MKDKNIKETKIKEKTMKGKYNTKTKNA